MRELGVEDEDVEALGVGVLGVELVRELGHPVRERRQVTDRQRLPCLVLPESLDELEVGADEEVVRVHRVDRLAQHARRPRHARPRSDCDAGRRPAMRSRRVVKIRSLTAVPARTVLGGGESWLKNSRFWQKSKT
ncbi:MAG: hypothetical protein U5R31_07480 [Acidimicrobiia bacterium]|nr:hypothetical protein [Acidimicrobiia bacterium]